MTPFDDQVTPIPLEIVPPSALEAMQRAEVDIQIATAKRYPMHDAAHLSLVKKEMLSFATLDQETAESCFYSLPRGGKSIQGPSVRLAEIALACYGNIRASTRVVETVSSGDQPHVVVQAMCHDLERNVAVCIEKRRRITTKKGKNAPDEDDITLATNAGSAIAIRDAVFKIIPGALIKPVYEEAKKVAIGDAKTLADRRAHAVDKVLKMGVTIERILGAINKASVEDIDLSALETLFGLYTAVKDGHTSVDDAFPDVVKKPEFKPRASSQSALPDVSSQPSSTRPKATPDDRPPTMLEILRKNMALAGISEADVLAYVESITSVEYKSIDIISHDTLSGMVSNWEGCKEQILEEKGA